MDEAAILRLLRFRTLRPAFDAALRWTVLPQMGGHQGVLAVRAGRRGPDEVGPRALLSLWSSRAAMEAVLGDDREGQETGALDEIADAVVDILPIITYQLELRPLRAGILRLAQGRASGVGLAGLTELVLRDLETSQGRAAGPGDLVVAGSEGGAFVIASTWPDWASIEAATGASISEPLRNKRSAEMEDFRVDHLELVGLSSDPV